MKSLRCHAFGAPETLCWEETPTAPLGGDDVRIRVRAAGIGFHDILMIAGQYQRKPEFPFAAGSDLAGEVIETGAGVTDLMPGERVAALVENGGHSEEAIASRVAVAPLPESISFESAAALIMPYGTAYQGLVDRARLIAGETLLVRGAAGGVGLAATQLGASLGARVLAAAGGAEKLALCRTAGADELIDSNVENVRDRVLEFTEGRGADVIFDPVGEPDFRAGCLSTIARDGRLLIVGFAGGEIPRIPAHYLINKFCAIIGVGFSGELVRSNPDDLRRILREVIDRCASGDLTPHIGAMVGPEGVAAAMNDMLARKRLGRAIIRMPD